MEENKRIKIGGVIFLTIILLLIYWFTYKNAEGFCEYMFYGQNTSCIIKETLGISDSFNISSISYFIGKNFWIILYVLLVYKIINPKKKKNISKANVEEKIVKEVKQKKEKEDSSIIDNNYSMKEIGIFVSAVVVMIIVTVLLVILLK